MNLLSHSGSQFPDCAYPARSWCLLPTRPGSSGQGKWTYLNPNCGELVTAAAAAAAAAAMAEMPGSESFCDAVVEAELGREIGSKIAGGGNTGGSSILIPRNWKGANWQG